MRVKSRAVRNGESSDEPGSQASELLEQQLRGMFFLDADTLTQRPKPLECIWVCALDLLER